MTLADALPPVAAITGAEVALLVGIATLGGILAAVAIAWGRWSERIDRLTATVDKFGDQLQAFALKGQRVDEHHDDIADMRGQVTRLEKRVGRMEGALSNGGRHDSAPAMRMVDDDSDRHGGG